MGHISRKPICSDQGILLVHHSLLVCANFVMIFQNLTLGKDAKAARNYRDELDAIREKVR